MPSDERLYFPRPIGIMMNHNTDIIGAAIRFHLEDGLPPDLACAIALGVCIKSGAELREVTAFLGGRGHDAWQNIPVDSNISVWNELVGQVASARYRLAEYEASKKSGKT